MSRAHARVEGQGNLLRRLVREETGMTMGLVVIMVVLIGVMGAGLLTFVQRDLESVVEVNQGQRGLEWAEAGVAAAITELSMNANGERYNGDSGDLDGDGSDAADSEWSYTGPGKTLNIDGADNRVIVTIQYLEPATAAQTELPNFAPEALPPGESSYPANRSYYKIVAQGTAVNANRRVEAIYYTRETGFPQAWYASEDINWNGNAFRSDNVSVFSRGNIFDFQDDNIGGCDTVYGDWNRPPWNSRARNLSPTLCRDDNGTPDDSTDDTTYTGYLVGVGAVGTIEYAGGGDRGGFLGVRDYDESTLPAFVDNDAWINAGGTQDTTSQISFPFNPDLQTQVDLDILRAVAASERNNSRLITAGPGDTVNVDDYPADAGPETVYFVEFVDSDGSYGAKGTVEYSSDAANANGTLVVVNGDLLAQGNEDFGGVIILRDPANNGLLFEVRGNIGMDGFANVEGGIFVRGSIDSTVSSPVIEARRTGLYTMERWSWRECYNITCT
jgi:hypothetical protein